MKALTDWLRNLRRGASSAAKRRSKRRPSCVRLQLEELEARIVFSFLPVAPSFPTGVHPYSVAAADVNGDGKPDLVVANKASNTVSVLLGNGNGSFQAALNFTTGTGPHSVAVAD